MSTALEWSTRSGDAWAERWQQTDRGLAEVGAALNAAVLAAAPKGPFRAFDIGCGAGSSSLALADARPDAKVLGCDLSAALVRIARSRVSSGQQLHFAVGDALQAAAREGPFDLFLSRHGVMFFPDPKPAFRALRASASDGATLTFSCFQGWEANPWASVLASAAAGKRLPPPGREPSGFAFADPAYVRETLEGGGWVQLEHRAVHFDYVAGEGGDAVDEALSFLSEIGPASSVLRSLPIEERGAAVQRMRAVISRYGSGGVVRFPAAGWIWSARAGRGAA